MSEPASTTPEHHAGHASAHGPHPKTPGDVAKLALGALGIVYGDIGTSPLYSIKECFQEPHGVLPTPANVLGVVSLFIWSLTLVVVVKYLTFVLRADNDGEGGTMALLSLLRGRPGEAPVRGLGVLMLVGLFGTSLLYGEGIITPAISVLSAVEGLEVAAPALGRFVLPITVVILVVLFMAQRRGTAKVGLVFGPTMLVWFLVIGGLGLRWVLREPGILAAFDPRHAAELFVHHKLHGFLLLGSVVLCITGGEALYADMGHFGRRPIRLAWYAVVFPGLILNYLGQGALLLASDGAPIESPFFALVEGVWLYPLVALSTCATVVASQALISGAFSLTQQAVLLGYWPRVNIVHTSGKQEGQIYIPEINGILMVACIALVLAFQRSGNLAAAYGLSVTGTMTITSVLLFVVARQRWGWKLPKAAGLVTLFLVVDLSFFAANLNKLPQGGWLPLAMGSVVFAMMTTWKRGRDALGAFMRAITLPLDMFLEDVERTDPPRVSGTAVFMTPNPDGAPPVLLHHFKHNKVLHEQVVLLSIQTRHVPEIRASERIETAKELEHGFFQVVAAYGFMQSPNVLEVLRLAEKRGVVVNPDDTTFYLGRETLIIDRKKKGMARWRKQLFGFLSRNARPANAFFRIPPNRVVELGTQIEL